MKSKEKTAYLLLIIHLIFLLKQTVLVFIYNTKILLPLTFDEQTDKKRHASTGNRTHD